MRDLKTAIILVIGLVVSTAAWAQARLTTTTELKVNGISVASATWSYAPSNFVVFAMDQYKIQPGMKNFQLLKTAFSIRVFGTAGKIPFVELPSFETPLTVRVYVPDPSRLPYLLSKDTKNGGWVSVVDVIAAKWPDDDYLKGFHDLVITHKATNDERYWELQLSAWPLGDPCIAW